jgi:hypothetical protein
MSQRMTFYRLRKKLGILAMIPVPLWESTTILLEELGYIKLPADREKIGLAIAELLSAIGSLSPDNLVSLAKTADNSTELSTPGE